MIERRPITCCLKHDAEVIDVLRRANDILRYSRQCVIPDLEKMKRFRPCDVEREAEKADG